MNTSIRTLLTASSLLLASASASASASAQVGHAQRIGPTDGAFLGDLDSFDRFGWAVAPLGDLDGDGTADVAVSSFLDDDGVPDVGAVWILFLEPDGTVKAHQKISATEGGFTGAIETADFFGTSLANVGDLDGDGIVDLAVGAYYDDDGGPDKGAVWILFLDTDGTVKSHAEISSTSGGLLAPLETVDWFGWAMAFLGDLDGDGKPELAVSADGDDDGGMDFGAVYILSLLPDGSVFAETKISATTGGFGGPLGPGAYFGSALAALGDVNGDGVGDLAVGADGDDEGGHDKGAMWIVFLAPDGTAVGETKISAFSGGLLGPLEDGDQFGRSAAPLGDFDGDTVPDLVVGADRTDTDDDDEGAIYLLMLHPDGTIKGEMRIDDTTCGFAGSLGMGNHFGNSVTPIGDLDGDGKSELLVGAEETHDTAPAEGSVWVLFLGAEDCNENGVPDACDIATGTSSDTNGNGMPDECEPIGTTYCEVEDNSTGLPARIEASGSAVAADNDLTLQVTQLPTGVFGYFLASSSAGFIANPGGSVGNLCLGTGDDLGRLVSQVRNSGNSGQFEIDVDLTSVPTATGHHAMVADDVWFFQSWYRDGQASNFSDAVRIRFL
ncbi:MAG: hypothetical protein GY711_02940 [bacterium]|nr:hypothetical protein [bacterium]